MRNPRTSSHQIYLTRTDKLATAHTVVVLHLTLKKPGDSLQTRVRVRGNMHATTEFNQVRTKVINKAPGTNRRAVSVR